MPPLEVTHLLLTPIPENLGTIPLTMRFLVGENLGIIFLLGNIPEICYSITFIKQRKLVITGISCSITVNYSGSII